MNFYLHMITFDKIWAMAPIEPVLKNDPEYHLVGKVKEGMFRERRTWVHIRNEKLIGITEVVHGLLGEMGSSSGPYYLPRNEIPLEYFRKPEYLK